MRIQRSPYLACLLIACAGTSVAQTFQVGPANNTIGTGSGYMFFPDGLRFDTIAPMTLHSVGIYPEFPGEVVVRLLNASGTVIDSKSAEVQGGGNLERIDLGFRVPAGMGYMIDAEGSSTPSLYRNDTGAMYPYTVPGLVSITEAINQLPGYYYFFYDWTVSFAGPVVGYGPDDDDDGFSDDFEEEAETDPSANWSTPLGGTPALMPLGPGVISKISIKMDFAKADSDAMQVSGDVPLPNDYVLDGARVVVDVAGVVKGFTLDEKGKAQDNGASISVKAPKNGVSSFTMKCSKTNLQMPLAENADLTNDDVSKAERTVRVSVCFVDQIVQTTDRVVVYSAKVDKNGKAK